jgi:aspartyl-tRNA(Asn)/glutamyl-tRNA(Gln) amidotransferase subunit C
MSVSIEEVEKIANLARLYLSEDEKKKLSKELSVILEYMAKLNELNTSTVKPLSHPLDLKNVYREDQLGESLSTAEALKNAPDKTDKYFKVPKVIIK